MEVLTVLTKNAFRVQLVGRLKSMEDVHEWMYTGHDAYSAGGKMKRLTGKDRAMYGGPGVPLKEL